MLNRKSIFNHVWRRTDLRCPLFSRTHNTSSNIADSKHTLIHKCRTNSILMYIHRLSLSALSGSTRYQNTLSNRNRSDRTSQDFDSLLHSMHSASVETLTVSQVKDSGTRIHTVYFRILKVYPALMHWCGMYAVLSVWLGLHCLNTMLS